MTGYGGPEAGSMARASPQENDGDDRNTREDRRQLQNLTNKGGVCDGDGNG